MRNLWRHQSNLTTLEWFAHTSNSPNALALNYQREFPCRLLMTSNLL